jgi:hypothetical protein
MADIEGTKKKDLSAIYLFPVIKRPLAVITGDDGEPIEGTAE